MFPQSCDLQFCMVRYARIFATVKTTTTTAAARVTATAVKCSEIHVEYFYRCTDNNDCTSLCLPVRLWMLTECVSMYACMYVCLYRQCCYCADTCHFRSRCTKLTKLFTFVACNILVLEYIRTQPTITNLRCIRVYTSTCVCTQVLWLAAVQFSHTYLLPTKIAYTLTHRHTYVYAQYYYLFARYATCGMWHVAQSLSDTFLIEN